MPRSNNDSARARRHTPKTPRTPAQLPAARPPAAHEPASHEPVSREASSGESASCEPTPHQAQPDEAAHLNTRNPLAFTLIDSLANPSRAARTRCAASTHARSALGPPPQNPAALASFLRQTLGLRIPGPATATGDRASPLEYLIHTFFEGRRFTHADPALDTCAPADCVVWANRGGGKTFLGALATTLDLVFKPRIQVRILGGSLEQSSRMHHHLTTFFELPLLAPLVRRGRNGTIKRRIVLTNGSAAEILAASETSIRGVRVQKVRCDEVDLFDPDLWRAVQLTTRALDLPGPWGRTVRGSIEALSTMHRPFGLMWDLAKLSTSQPPPAGEVSPQATVGAPAFSPAPSPSSSSSCLIPNPSSLDPFPRPLFRWGLIDALEHCGPEHHCPACNLLPDCRGRAKATPPAASGHIHIADARAQKLRVDVETWRSEMLCLEPRTHDLVYPEFNPRAHVYGFATDPDDAPLAHPAHDPAPADPLAPEFLSRSAPRAAANRAASPVGWVGGYIAGIDFGFRDDTAILLARLDDSGNIYVEHESVARQRILAWHIDRLHALLARRGGPRALRFLAADPAGNAHNQQTGRANTALLKDSGLPVRTRAGLIADGIKAVRARLAPADGPPRLFIHARCTRLIDCLRRYHYDTSDLRSQTPVKGEFDHACDALRYMIATLDARNETKTGRW